MTDPVERVARAIAEVAGMSLDSLDMKVVRAAIAAMPGEPVAWQYFMSGTWGNTDTPPTPQELAAHPERFRPLYAAPAMPATDAMREALESSKAAMLRTRAASIAGSNAHGDLTRAIKLCDAALSHPSQGGWRLIETIPISSSGWIKRCLFGRMQPWGWEEWVGQRDSFDIWLGRKGDGGCFDCAMPTHWMPLPPAPPEVQP